MAYKFKRHSELIDWIKLQKDLCEGFNPQQTPIQRGSIFFCELGENVANELSGKRPVLVISDSRKNKYNNNITVVPLTSAWRKLKTESNKALYRKNKHHVFKPGDYSIRKTQYLLLKKDFKGLSNDSIVTCEHITTVSKARLSPNSIQLVDDSTMKQIEKRILDTLAMR